MGKILKTSTGKILKTSTGKILSSTASVKTTTAAPSTEGKKTK